MVPRKTPARAGKVTKSAGLSNFTIRTPDKPQSAAVPPSRAHQASYHYPLLVDGHSGSEALLDWFTSVEKTRNMPWRKPWLNPKDFEGRDEELGKILGQRAYEVWVSEVSKYTTGIVSTSGTIYHAMYPIRFARSCLPLL